MGSKQKPDFSGYATKAGIKCADGRTILADAFKHQDQEKVPLVWQHNHDEPKNILGYAILEHRNDGVYTYAYFNDTEQGKNAKLLVEHGDIKALSIYANKLREKARQVAHGVIREVSLVMAGANPEALIDNVMLQHSDGQQVILDDEAIIYTGETLQHEEPPAEEEEPEETDNGETIKDVYDSMTAEQKAVTHFVVGAALDEAKDGDTLPAEKKTDDDNSAEHSATNNEIEEGKRMSRNVFDQTTKDEGSDNKKHTLSHDALKGIVADAERTGSLKQAVEAYAEEHLEHGINDIDLLFPDARTITQTPDFDSRRMEWVKSVLGGTKHSPFSRIKSLTADITLEEARAKGYIKGTLKKEEFFGLVKRVTTPSTIYKKQKLDRDDILDITDFDVVVWLKAEMRMMLEEELARAILISDGRAVDDEDKIKDPIGANEGAGIRSIYKDDDLYAATINVDLKDANSSASEIVDQIIKSMRFYKGSGSPTFYTTLPRLTYMLMAKDTTGRRLYRTKAELATELQVSDIVTVESMEDETDLVGIIVNLQDYTIGADKGGETSFFDDFDIDYNQYKYLIETRLSGGLTKIRSALIVMDNASGDTLVTPNVLPFNGTVIDWTAQTGVTYKRADTGATVTADITLSSGQTLKIVAVPSSGSYYFDNNVEDEWTYKYGEDGTQ